MVEILCIYELGFSRLPYGFHVRAHQALDEVGRSALATGWILELISARTDTIVRTLMR